jgi:kynurenine formamidase
VINVFEGYRFIDLSEEFIPDVLTEDGYYTRTNQTRRGQLRDFLGADTHNIMQFVDFETHIMTHVEVPRHFTRDGKSCSEMPIEKFFGEAVIVNLSHLKPKDGKRQPVKSSDLAAARGGDIVLMWSDCKRPYHPYFTAEAMKWLVDLPVKAIGIDRNVSPEDPNFMHDLSLPEANATHKICFGNGNEVPIFENLLNLDKIKKDRVFFIGLPLKVRHMDASWVRAIALEPIS